MPFTSKFCGDRHFKTSERELFRPIHQIVPHDFFDKMFRDRGGMDHVLTSMMNRVTMKDTSVSDYKKFVVNIDVHHFTPDEISVKVVDGHVVVECRHEERMDDHGFVSRHFVRKFPLPTGCLPDTVESRISSDGILTVTAPKVLPMPSVGERVVQIVKTGPVRRKWDY